MKILSIINILIFTAILTCCAAAPSATKETLKPLRNVHLTIKNTVIFDQSVHPAYVDTFIKAAIGARAALPIIETMYIVIASSGGYYQDGTFLMNILKTLPNTELICKYCASMAGQIFAATGLKRLVIGKSSLMMHEMFIEKLTAEEAKDELSIKQLLRNSDAFNKVMYTMIGITKEKYEEKIIDTEWTLTGKDIIKNHLADELVTVSCDILVLRLLPNTCNP
jgi:ATP-dependent protease ClpP protease subunit